MYTLNFLVWPAVKGWHCYTLQMCYWQMSNFGWNLLCVPLQGHGRWALRRHCCQRILQWSWCKVSGNSTSTCPPSILLPPPAPPPLSCSQIPLLLEPVKYEPICDQGGGGGGWSHMVVFKRFHMVATFSHLLAPVVAIMCPIASYNASQPSHTPLDCCTWLHSRGRGSHSPHSCEEDFCEALQGEKRCTYPGFILCLPCPPIYIRCKHSQCIWSFKDALFPKWTFIRAGHSPATSSVLC